MLEVRRLAVIVTVTVNIDMLYAHIIERGTDPLYNYVCMCAPVPTVVPRKQFWVCTCGSVWGLNWDSDRPFTNPPAVTVLSLADFAEFHVPVWDLLSLTLAGILRFNDQQSLPSSGSVTITSALPLLKQMQLSLLPLGSFWFRIPELTECAMTID